MVDEQTKRAIETMELCGCEIDALISMFPRVDSENVRMIWPLVCEYTHDLRECAEERLSKNEY